MAFWYSFLGDCIENPGQWLRSPPYATRRAVVQRCTQFTNANRFGTDMLEAERGHVGTWHYTFGLAENGLMGWQHFCWFKWVPKGGEVGPEVPDLARRFHSVNKKLRRLTARDIRTRRSVRTRISERSDG